MALPSTQNEFGDDRRPHRIPQPQNGSPGLTGSRRWRAFALLVVAYFMTIVDLTVVNVALPTIGVKLHFPESDLQWVVTAYGLTFGGFLLLGGRAADLLGRGGSFWPAWPFSPRRRWRAVWPPPTPSSSSCAGSRVSGRQSPCPPPSRL